MRPRTSLRWIVKQSEMAAHLQEGQTRMVERCGCLLCLSQTDPSTTVARGVGANPRAPTLMTLDAKTEPWTSDETKQTEWGECMQLVESAP